MKDAATKKDTARKELKEHNENIAEDRVRNSKNTARSSIARVLSEQFIGHCKDLILKGHSNEHISLFASIHGLELCSGDSFFGIGHSRELKESTQQGAQRHNPRDLHCDF